jgi:hypothetical protein
MIDQRIPTLFPTCGLVCIGVHGSTLPPQTMGGFAR